MTQYELLDFIRKNGNFVSVNTMVEGLGIGRSGINRKLKALVAQKFVDVELRRTETNHRTYVYSVRDGVTWG